MSVPARRRRVAYSRERGLSARRACTLFSVARSALRYQSRMARKDAAAIERMRELCQGFALKSARGRGKVVLIDGADDLNRESANCFLKTLEEPPPRSVLILIGSSPDRQLPTIV